MAQGNNVTVIGNLVEDPELRFTPSGQAMAKFRIAVSKRWQDRASGEWKEESSFFGCTAWRDQAENIAESLRKGHRVIVSGALQQRNWETQEGDKRSIIEILVDEVGPSLRWATAEVTKTPRKESVGEWGAAQPAAVGAGEPGPDEEPF